MASGLGSQQQQQRQPPKKREEATQQPQQPLYSDLQIDCDDDHHHHHHQHNNSETLATKQIKQNNQETSKQREQHQRQHQSPIKVTLTSAPVSEPSVTIEPEVSSGHQRGAGGRPFEHRSSSSGFNFLLDDQRSSSIGAEYSIGGAKEAGQDSKRPSTATLISAADSQAAQQAERRAPDTRTINQSPSPSPDGFKLARLEREEQLRRIASQRRRRPEEAAPNHQAAAAEETRPTGQQQTTTNKPQQPVTEPTVTQTNSNQQQQLAIYINGKIRSNSIFCRSTSSNSFNNILKLSFSANSNSNSASESRAAPPNAKPNDDQTNLLLALPDRSALVEKKRKKSTAKDNNDDDDNNNNNKRQQLSRLFAGLCSNKQLEVEESQRVASSQPRKSSGLREEQEEEQQQNSSSYKLNPSSMFLRKAMRYYRLWIYSANIIILLGALIFVVSTIYVTSDSRIKLIVSGGESNKRQHFSTEQQTNEQQQRHQNRRNQSGSNEEAGDESDSTFGRVHEFGVRLDEPALMVAYVAIAVQLGVLQAIGCFGAIRMKEKWIQAFWYLIFLLILVDVAFLTYWLQRYDLMSRDLRREMSFRLSNHFVGDVSIEQALDDGVGEQGEEEEEEEEEKEKGRQLQRRFDKIFTEILNKIQHESSCCGISSSLDYKQSKWRLTKQSRLLWKLNQENNLNVNNENDNNNNNNNNGYDNILLPLLKRVPLVPASCCLAASVPPALGPSSPGSQSTPGRPLDDSQLPWRPRVPAWSPSMVVGELHSGAGGHYSSHLRPSSAFGGPAHTAGSDTDDNNYHDNNDADQPASARTPTLADLIDRRWMRGWLGEENHEPPAGQLADDHHHHQDNSDDAKSSANRRRLQAKQIHYNGGQQEASPLNSNDDFQQHDVHQFDSSEAMTTTNKRPPPPPRRRRRWLVQSTVDDDEHVLMRIIDSMSLNDHRDDEDDNLELNKVANCDMDDSNVVENKRQRRARRQLEALQLVLFNGSFAGEHRRGATTKSHWIGDHHLAELFKWPNKLQLTYNQYKLVEGYLLAEMGAGDEGIRGEQRGRRRRRGQRSIDLDASGEQQQQGEPWGASGNQSEWQQELKRKLRAQLAKLVESDPELSCSPSSYFDQSTINTRGCHEHIKAWLDSSVHILFVMGFCVLTVLKFCSLILLRLEIREMIHKIRVLKGMATEYNALHDLEAYLPRPSVCAQAAELTSSGVAPALPGMGATATSANLNQQLAAVNSAGSSVGSSFGPPPRIGGSFSEAVAAATAAAHQHQLAASSMKTILGGGGGGEPHSCSSTRHFSTSMLMPHSAATGGLPGQTSNLLCARSSSVSAAHLQGASLCAAQQACSLRSDLFPTGPMPRRHTAVSVCPAAAAAAAAAAHHLMSRRGTYAVANPITFTTTGATFANQSQHALGQHRHSAHTVTLAAAAAPTSPSSASSQHLTQSKNLSTNTLTANIRGPPSRAGKGGTSTAPTGPPEKHLLSLVANCQRLDCAPQSAAATTTTTTTGTTGTTGHTFKRQSSGGAQSAVVNYSLDTISPTQLAESRRSIH